MAYALLADLVVLLHLVFVLFVVAGGFLALRWPRLARLHLPAAAWGAIAEFSGSRVSIDPAGKLAANARWRCGL